MSEISNRLIKLIVSRDANPCTWLTGTFKHGTETRHPPSRILEIKQFNQRHCFLSQKYTP